MGKVTPEMVVHVEWVISFFKSRGAPTYVMALETLLSEWKDRGDLITTLNNSLSASNWQVAELERSLAEARAHEEETHKLVAECAGDDDAMSVTLPRLKRERGEARDAHDKACSLVAKMHQAAVGRVTGPICGVIEDVEDVRKERDEARGKLEKVVEALERCRQPGGRFVLAPSHHPWCSPWGNEGRNCDCGAEMLDEALAAAKGPSRAGEGK